MPQGTKKIPSVKAVPSWKAWADTLFGDFMNTLSQQPLMKLASKIPYLGPKEGWDKFTPDQTKDMERLDINPGRFKFDPSGAMNVAGIYPSSRIREMVGQNAGNINMFKAQLEGSLAIETKKLLEENAKHSFTGIHSKDLEVSRNAHVNEHINNSVNALNRLATTHPRAFSRLAPAIPYDESWNFGKWFQTYSDDITTALNNGRVPKRWNREGLQDWQKEMLNNRLGKSVDEIPMVQVGQIGLSKSLMGRSPEEYLKTLYHEAAHSASNLPNYSSLSQGYGYWLNPDEISARTIGRRHAFPNTNSRSYLNDWITEAENTANNPALLGSKITPDEFNFFKSYIPNYVNSHFQLGRTGRKAVATTSPGTGYFNLELRPSDARLKYPHDVFDPGTGETIFSSNDKLFANKFAEHLKHADVETLTPQRDMSAYEIKFKGSKPHLNQTFARTEDLLPKPVDYSEWLIEQAKKVKTPEELKAYSKLIVDQYKAKRQTVGMPNTNKDYPNRPNPFVTPGLGKGTGAPKLVKKNTEAPGSRILTPDTTLYHGSTRLKGNLLDPKNLSSDETFNWMPSWWHFAENPKIAGRYAGTDGSHLASGLGGSITPVKVGKPTRYLDLTEKIPSEDLDMIRDHLVNTDRGKYVDMVMNRIAEPEGLHAWMHEPILGAGFPAVKYKHPAFPGDYFNHNAFAIDPDIPLFNNITKEPANILRSTYKGPNPIDFWKRFF